MTVRVAALVVALPLAFVKTALYWLPLIACVTLFSVSEVEVAPLMMAKVAPPSVLSFHWMVGAGEPLAAAVNVTELPAVTV